MGALEPPHLIAILAIVLIIFGPGKLPELGKAIGESFRELRRATTDQPAARRAADEARLATPPAANAAVTRMCSACRNSIGPTDRFCGTCGAAQQSSGTAATDVAL
jgi:TatA/E family protein of Tat protein translocase